MSDLRFAVLGAGFWARFQLAAWHEIEGAQCVALCDRVRGKAETLAGEFGVPAVYDQAEELLKNEKLDFIDIITDVDTHPKFVAMAAKHGLAAICQKLMAANLELCRQMVETCRQAAVPYFIHENWRWQTPLRQLKQVLQSTRIGRPFRARIDFNSSFPVFDNQPFLKELEQFILTDVGSHTLDTARFLFGEAQTLYCTTQRIHQDIKGEDVASVVMQMNGATVTCNLSYASRTEQERFPQTFVFVEGTEGSVELAPDYWIRITNDSGTLSRRYAPPFYVWADQAYDLIHSSIVDCNRNLLRALQTGSLPETHGADNLKTMELVFAAYESASSGQVVDMAKFVTGA